MSAKLHASLPPSKAGGAVIIRCQRHSFIPKATASPQTSSQSLITEKNIKTGSQRSVSLSSSGSSILGPIPPALQSPQATSIKSFFLPQGWPHSVTEDYLQYQLWTFPSHITGWMSHSLAGSSMLKALGVGGGAAGAVGFAAAIKWVTKDGIGAAGRLFVGGRLSSVFDEDPKRWRMIAEAVTTCGLALEIATQLFPSNFIALAGSGTLAKATGKGMGRPCFRVVQTHFASQNNVGDVSAKEEVWEVAAQMLGLAASVALLSALEAAGTPEAVVPLWAGIHGVHVALRYYALTKLRFPYPNFKRGAALVSRHVTDGHVLSIEEANTEEPMLPGPNGNVAGIQCVFGCSIEEALCAAEKMDLKAVLERYRNEQYLLTWRNGTAYVVLWENATPVDMLRALWQAAWLHHHQTTDSTNNPAATEELLIESLEAMQEQFPGFAKHAAEAGWEIHRGVFPTGSFRLAKE